MKSNFLSATILTLCCIVLFCFVYTAVICGIAQFAPRNGKGEIIKYTTASEKYGFVNIGQSFTADKYFWSRPSAAGYNAAASAGSNKGPSNPDYLSQVQARIDTFLIHNPGVKKSEVTAELVTASGSGLDPDLSPDGAYIQAQRVAKVRNIPVDRLNKLVEEHIEKPLLGMFGPEKVNVLKLNIALDNLK